MIQHYLERALFVIGEQNDGKSSQIRDIFRDRRFHRNGKSRIGEQGRLDDGVAISNERWLHIRLTSPHEYGETTEEFFDKIGEKQSNHKYRWNFLGALQLSAHKQMPDPENVIARFVNKFGPERTRALIIYRGFDGILTDQATIQRIIAGLSNVDCEIALIDARRNEGLQIADFFDFT